MMHGGREESRDLSHDTEPEPYPMMQWEGEAETLSLDVIGEVGREYRLVNRIILLGWSCLEEGFLPGEQEKMGSGAGEGDTVVLHHRIGSQCIMG